MNEDEAVDLGSFIHSITAFQNRHNFRVFLKRADPVFLKTY